MARFSGILIIDLSFPASAVYDSQFCNNCISEISKLLKDRSGFVVSLLFSLSRCFRCWMFRKLKKTSDHFCVCFCFCWILNIWGNFHNYWNFPFLIIIVVVWVDHLTAITSLFINKSIRPSAASPILTLLMFIYYFFLSDLVQPIYCSVLDYNLVSESLSVGTGSAALFRKNTFCWFIGSVSTVMDLLLTFGSL